MPFLLLCTTEEEETAAVMYAALPNAEMYVPSPAAAQIMTAAAAAIADVQTEEEICLLCVPNLNLFPLQALMLQ